MDISAQDPTQQQQRDQLLSQVTELHTRLNEARSQYEEVAAQLDLSKAAEHQAAARVTLDDLFGRDSDEENEGLAAAGGSVQLKAGSGTGDEDVAGPARTGLAGSEGEQQQGQQLQTQGQDGQKASLGRPTPTAQQAQQQQQQQERQQDFQNPYDSFLDPDAPRKPTAESASARPGGSTSGQGRAGDKGGASSATAAGAGPSGRHPRQGQQGGAAGGSSLPESVRKALAEQVGAVCSIAHAVKGGKGPSLRQASIGATRALCTLWHLLRVPLGDLH